MGEMDDRLIDLDVLQPAPERVAVGAGESAYVLVWADFRPLAVEIVPGRGGWIEGSDLERLASKYRGSLPTAESAEPRFQPSVSVVLSTFRRETRLPTILSALYGQEYGDFEIVVVDNAPRQSSVPAMVGRFGRAKYVSEARRGLRFARNAACGPRGARLSRSSTMIVCRTGDGWRI